MEARARRVAAAVTLALAAVLALRSPDGSAPSSATRTVYLSGDRTWRLAPTNLVPEVDQLALASHLVWLVDPLLDRRGAARLRAAIRDVYLPGEREPSSCLSNGGRGVTRAMAAGAEGYRGLVFLSAVIEPRVLENPAWEPRWRGRPVLVVHGERDDRIPVDYLDEGVGMLREAGVDVTQRLVAGEDHFLIFTRPEVVFDEVGRWMRRLD